MATLGFDTATEVLTVAVAGGGGPLAEAEHGPAADGRPRHSALLLAGIERCVEESGGWQGIERIAVGLGPGLLHRPADRHRDRAGAGPGPGARAARHLHPVGAGPRDRRAARGGRPAARWRSWTRGVARPSPSCTPSAVGRRRARWCSRRKSWASSPEGTIQARWRPGTGRYDFGRSSRPSAPRSPLRGTRPTGSRRGTSARSRSVVSAAPAERIEPIYLREPDAKRWRARDE